MAFFRPRNKPPSAKAVQQWLDTGEAAPHVQVPGQKPLATLRPAPKYPV